MGLSCATPNVNLVYFINMSVKESPLCNVCKVNFGPFNDSVYGICVSSQTLPSNYFGYKNISNFLWSNNLNLNENSIKWEDKKITRFCTTCACLCSLLSSLWRIVCCQNYVTILYCLYVTLDRFSSHMNSENFLSK